MIFHSYPSRLQGEKKVLSVSVLVCNRCRWHHKCLDLKYFSDQGTELGKALKWARSYLHGMLPAPLTTVALPWQDAQTVPIKFVVPDLPTIPSLQAVRSSGFTHRASSRNLELTINFVSNSPSAAGSNGAPTSRRFK